MSRVKPATAGEKAARANRRGDSTGTVSWLDVDDGSAGELVRLDEDLRQLARPRTECIMAGVLAGDVAEWLFLLSHSRLEQRGAAFADGGSKSFGQC